MSLDIDKPAAVWAGFWVGVLLAALLLSGASPV